MLGVSLRERLGLVAFLAVLLTGVAAAPAGAEKAAEASGVWYDHTGRGAVEISDCGGRLCGQIVWLDPAVDGKACGKQIIGNAKPVGKGRWDKGWILDPEDNNKYDVELTSMGPGKLRVHGYMGSKSLGETMIWTRAPGDLKHC
jgi:uncharacterized protein (DUF2147 family)